MFVCAARALESLPTVAQLKQSDDEAANDLADKVCELAKCIKNTAGAEVGLKAKDQWRIGSKADQAACLWTEGMPSIGLPPANGTQGESKVANQLWKTFSYKVPEGVVLRDGNGVPKALILSTDGICSDNAYQNKSVVFEECFHWGQRHTHPDGGNHGPGAEVKDLDLDGLLYGCNVSYNEVQATLEALKENAGQAVTGETEAEREAAQKKKDEQSTQLLCNLQTYLTELCKYFDPAEAKAKELEAAGQAPTPKQKRSLCAFRDCKNNAKAKLGG